MIRRCGILLALALGVGASGCAGTARRTDGTPIYGRQAWNEAPAPPQKTVAAEPSKIEAEPLAKPDGLAKYFPGLNRATSEPAKVATRYRPTWFGLRPRGPQIYTTDARAGLNQRSGPEPTILPVALQVPIDRAVTPTTAQSARPDNSSANPSDPGVNRTQDNQIEFPSKTSRFSSKPSEPVEDAGNPLPTANVPSDPAVVVNRMPGIPSVDPLDSSKPATPTPSEPAAEQSLAVIAQTPPPPQPPEEKPAPAITPTPAPQEKPAAPAITPTPAAEEKPPLAVTPPTRQNPPSGSNEPKVPLFYTSKISPLTPAPDPMQELEISKVHRIFASPQVASSPQVLPSPQSGIASASHHWKRPCLRRLVRKVWKLGEYAEPPTASPH